MSSVPNEKASSTVLFEQHGSIGTMTFNRPEVYNAMSTELILAFRDVTAEIKKSTTLRVLIVRGAGKAFLAGGDVGQFYQQKDSIGEDVRALGDILNEGIINIRTMPFPVIAQVHGACAGAGLSLMLACDFAIASTTAQFKTAYTQIGLSPDGGSTYFLPRLVGMKVATELIMLSEGLSGEQALARGLVNRCVAPEVLNGETQMLATRLSQGATQAYARAKLLINQSFETPIKQHLDDEIAMFAECAKTDDFKEGVTAFVEKRKPNFIGK